MKTNTIIVSLAMLLSSITYASHANEKEDSEVLFGKLGYCVGHMSRILFDVGILSEEKKIPESKKKEFRDSVEGLTEGAKNDFKSAFLENNNLFSFGNGMINEKKIKDVVSDGFDFGFFEGAEEARKITEKYSSSQYKHMEPDQLSMLAMLEILPMQLKCDELAKTIEASGNGFDQRYRP